MKRLTVAMIASFAALFVSFALYWVPVTVVSIRLPDWSVLYIKDFKTEMMALQSCKEYGGDFQKFEPSEFNFLGEHGHSNSWFIWIEVNNKEKGISCLEAVKSALIYSHSKDYGGEIFDEKYFNLRNEFLIDHQPLRKSNGVRYILLIILIMAMSMEIDGICRATAKAMALAGRGRAA